MRDMLMPVLGLFGERALTAGLPLEMLTRIRIGRMGGGAGNPVGR